MRKGVLFALTVSIVFVLILAVAPSGFSQVVTLKYSNFFPAPHKHSLLAEQWGIEVEKRTNGRVKVYYPAATLTPAAQTYDSVVKGIADISMSCQAYTRGKFPLSEVIDLPLSYRSGLVATRMTNEFLKKFQPKEYDETQVMFLHAHGPGILHTKKPVTKLEEMKGLKVRSTGLSAKIVQALGGAPVGMPMNKAKWNSLPKDAHAIIEKLNDEWLEKTGKLWDEIDLEGKDYAIQKGMKFLPLSKEEDARWAKAVRPILDEYAQDAKAKGLPGDQALKLCQDYLTSHQ